MSQKYISTLLFFLFLSITITLYAQDNTQMGLPEGAIARLGKGGINTMQFSPDGKYLAVGTDIGVWLYNVKSESVKALLPDKSIEVNNYETTTVVSMNEEWDVQTVSHVDALAFSPDSRLLASGGSSNSVIRIWELKTGQELLHLPLVTMNDGVHALTFSKDSKTLIAPNQLNIIYHWDISNGKVLTRHKGRSTDNEPLENGFYGNHHRDLIAFTQDNRTFISGDPDNGKIRLWDAITGYQLAFFQPVSIVKVSPGIKQVNPLGITYIVFAPNGKVFASGHKDKIIRLWKTTDNSVRAILKEHTDIVEAMAFSFDGNILASSGTENDIILWDVGSRLKKRVLPINKGSIRALAFSPVKKEILASGNSDGTIRFWNTDTGESKIFSTGHVEEIKDLAFTHDNSILTSVVSHNLVQKWNLDKIQELPSSLKEYNTTGVAILSKDASLYANHGAEIIVRRNRVTFKPDKETHIWNLISGKEILNLQQEAEILTISPDNTTLAAAIPSNKIISLYDIESGRELSQIPSWCRYTGKMTISLNGVYLGILYGSKPEIWDITSEIMIETPDTSFIKTLVFSPDNSLLALKSNKGIELWLVNPIIIEEHQKIRSDYKGSSNEIILFSPDGNILLEPIYDFYIDYIILWDVNSGRRLGTLYGHNEVVDTLVFSHDRKILATGAADGTILLWDWEKINKKISTGD
ncbi:hypothetical protein JT359_20430 [Candidatus Poribacteria bacterium]|nr:hypothetical protein [Candidatus Poribacteria bacterium]